MSDFTTEPQFDLFEALPDPPRQRGGIPRHVPTPETRLQVSEMKAAGATQECIARALGIGTSTLATRYYPSNPNPPMGRRRHVPTLATRKIVRRAIAIGMTQAQVAKLIGISMPTLRLHYGNELSRGRPAKSAP